MGYLALYRKWRPKTFEDVIGQDHIVKTLKNQINASRIGHAYLFCGTRGTGKTSTAKIFAKALNCEALVDGEPCNQCEACYAANAGQGINVIEIDAASNNSVDNIREIREEVKYTPTKGRYKVYIIDEVHMLSVGAFNALLKTLEEPPEHVIFILATTEPHKILPTILSRCQRYDFKRIGVSEIASQISDYMGQEGTDVEEQAIKYIATLADGSMRDALSILDQCIAFYLDQTITMDMVLELLGAVDQGVFFDMTEALVAKDSLKAIQLIDKVIADGRDINQFVLHLIKHLRNLLVIQSTNGHGDILDLSEENVKRLMDQATQVSYHDLTRFLSTLSSIESALKYATQKRILLEINIIKLCQVETDQSFDGLMVRIKALEEKIQKGVQVVAAPAGQKQPKTEIIKPTKKPKAVPDEVKQAAKKWTGVKERIAKANPSMLVVLDHLTAGYISDDILYLVCQTKVQEDILKEDENRRLNEINETYEEVFGKRFNIRPINQQEYDRLYATYYGNTTEEQAEPDNEEDQIKKIMEKVDFPIEVQ
ncbi:DNA polymerase III subunit gamma/tau [Vallitalea okinawensis]|uniref:DNA polymerase III subunit gamma/tau n=1 Tax=Vallitalea okinawensis TaxID=2078660 RepID=UPI000CFCA6C4|nr:DNA polymerase III subunit gamma/tau [Vallitalea okinawensis]